MACSDPVAHSNELKQFCYKKKLLRASMAVKWKDRNNDTIFRSRLKIQCWLKWTRQFHSRKLRVADEYVQQLRKVLFAIKAAYSIQLSLQRRNTSFEIWRCSMLKEKSHRSEIKYKTLLKEMTTVRWRSILNKNAVSKLRSNLNLTRTRQNQRLLQALSQSAGFLRSYWGRWRMW